MAAKKKPTTRTGPETQSWTTAKKNDGSGYVKRYEARKRAAEALENVPWWYKEQVLGDLGSDRTMTRQVGTRYITGRNPQTLPENRFFNKKKKQR